MLSYIGLTDRIVAELSKGDKIKTVDDSIVTIEKVVVNSITDNNVDVDIHYIDIDENLYSCFVDEFINRMNQPFNP